MLQRALRASVTVNGEVVGAFDVPGLVVLLGVTHADGPREIEWMANKIRDVRLLRDDRSLGELGAPALVISQFTLYGDARKGRRPTWNAAAPGPVAEPIYDEVCDRLADLGTPVSRGRFGADMALELVNDGPVTIILDSPSTSAHGGSLRSSANPSPHEGTDADMVRLPARLKPLFPYLKPMYVQATRLAAPDEPTSLPVSWRPPPTGRRTDPRRGGGVDRRTLRAGAGLPRWWSGRRWWVSRQTCH